MSAEIIELSKYIKNNPAVPVYRDVTEGALCADGNPPRPFTSWMEPKKQYDMTEFPNEMLFDADLENMHYDIEELAIECHRQFLVGHEKLLAEFIGKWHKDWRGDGG